MKRYNSQTNIMHRFLVDVRKEKITEILGSFPVYKINIKACLLNTF